MRELYEKYLSENEMMSYDQFEEYVNKLPIKYFDTFSENVDYLDKDTIKTDLMEAAIDVDWLYPDEIDEEEMTVSFETSLSIPTNALNVFHEVCDLLNSKGWTVSNADEIEDELVELGKEDYRQLLLDLLKEKTDAEIEALYKSLTA